MVLPADHSDVNAELDQFSDHRSKDVVSGANGHQMKATGQKGGIESFQQCQIGAVLASSCKDLAPLAKGSLGDEDQSGVASDHHRILFAHTAGGGVVLNDSLKGLLIAASMFFADQVLDVDDVQGPVSTLPSRMDDCRCRLLAVCMRRHTQVTTGSGQFLSDRPFADQHR